jgi:hypothetical protein
MRPISGPRDADAIRFIFDKACTNAAACSDPSEISSRQHEPANTSVHDGPNFEVAAADVTIFREQNPLAFTDYGEPFCIPGPGRKVLMMDFDVRSCGSKRVSDDVPSQAFVDEIDERSLGRRLELAPDRFFDFRLRATICVQSGTVRHARIA